ncbi:MAG TPA: hypothetical protein GXX40_07680 [Firmicutes bacterium]|nr:hypothetical protein [Bacillota bacterium]
MINRNQLAGHEMHELHEIIQACANSLEKAQLTVNQVTDPDLRNVVQECIRTKHNQIRAAEDLLKNTGIM